jgi:hypothetical protein
MKTASLYSGVRAQRTDVTTIKVLLREGVSAKATTPLGINHLRAVFLGLLGEGSTVMSWRRHFVSTEEWRGGWEPSASLSLLEAATVLLDAGADPNACRVDGLSVLHVAILTAWRVGDAASVELLVSRGADVDKAIPGTKFGGARPIHFALEAPTIIEAWINCNAGVIQALKEQKGRPERVTESLVSMLLAQQASLDVGSSTSSIGLKELLMCNSTSLQPMLKQGVPINSAIGTCNSAAKHTATFIRYIQAEAVIYGVAVSNLALSTWIEARQSGKGWQNIQIVADLILHLSQSLEREDPWRP